MRNLKKLFPDAFTVGKGGTKLFVITLLSYLLLGFLSALPIAVGILPLYAGVKLGITLIIVFGIILCVLSSLGGLALFVYSIVGAIISILRYSLQLFQFLSPKLPDQKLFSNGSRKRQFKPLSPFTSRSCSRS